MNKGEIINWLNNNEGVVAVAIFVLTIVLGWISGLFKLIFKLIFGKRSSSKPSENQIRDMKAGRDIIVGSENVNILNIQTTGFSDLKKQISDMESGKKKVLKKMKATSESVKSAPKTDPQDYERVITLIYGESTEDKKKELRALFYSSNDNIARLQIIIALASWFVPLKDKINDFLDICDEGIRIADSISAKSEKAVLLAYKGKFVSLQFSEEYLSAVYSIQASYLTRIPSVSVEEKQRVIKKLHKLDKLLQKCFAEAEKVAKESRDYDALAYVYMLIGETAGQRYNLLKNFAPDRAEDKKRLCKRAFLLAKDIYSAAGDELRTANSLHNLANQLRFFDETEEAKQLTKKVIEIATKHNDQQLLTKAKELLERIISGKIPNYMGGENF